MPRIKFFAIAYAGASAEQVYRPWASGLGEGFDLIPLEIRGHGRLTGQDFHASIQDAAQYLFGQIKARLNDDIYVVYGHSMGCLIAYELLLHLADSSLPLPTKLCLSGRNPPDFDYPSRDFYRLRDDDFIHEISQYGGNLKQLFGCPEMRDIFLPVLRADYRLLGKYTARKPELVTPACDTLFFYSDSDPLVCPEAIKGWQRFLDGDLRISHFSGDHFFIQSQFAKICQEIQENIYPLICPQRLTQC